MCCHSLSVCVSVLFVCLCCRFDLRSSWVLGPHHWHVHTHWHGYCLFSPCFPSHNIHSGIPRGGIELLYIHILLHYVDVVDCYTAVVCWHVPIYWYLYSSDVCICLWGLADGFIGNSSHSIHPRALISIPRSSSTLHCLCTSFLLTQVVC